MNRHLLSVCVASTISMCICEATHADVATTFALPQSSFNGSFVNGVDGYDFTPTTNLNVTALGWYDHQGDGLLHDHPVGIYVTDTETLVAASATITSSTPLDVTSNFRYANINPFTLTAGVTYTLAGYGQGPTFDPYVRDPSGGITFGSGIEFVRARSGASSGLEFPTEQSQIGIIQAIYFGPNFIYTPAVVPEPSIVGAGFLGTLLILRRNRTSCET